MSFISYAQNQEDVMLWRALKHVKNGFYIDVGANDPNVDSVTKAFYERGWKGINVEPLKSHHQDLLEARPNDINLLCAAGFKNGQIDIWECDVRGWATASSDVIQQHEQAGHTGVLHKVPLFALGDICEEYVQGDIHFLKIDVEGFEKDVLEGMNFKKFRPWIVVIEATRPNTIEEIHKDWETLVISNDYVFAYADGLNRFYVSKERTTNLLGAFRYPPNVFDGYIRVQQYDSETSAQQAEAKVQQAEAKVQQAEAKVQQAEAKVQQAEAFTQQYLLQLHVIYSSISWQITKPLRTAKVVVRAFIVEVIRLVVRQAKVLVHRFPITKPVAIWTLRRAPFLMRLVTRFSENRFGAPEKLKNIREFDQLGATRIMIVLSKLPAHNSESPVTFLEVRDDVS